MQLIKAFNKRQQSLKFTHWKTHKTLVSQQRERKQKCTSTSERRYVRSERLRCHNMKDKRAADRGDGSWGQSKQCVSQRTHKDNTGVINCKHEEQEEEEEESPLQAVTISLVLPKHRIHAGNNSHI